MGIRITSKVLELLAQSNDLIVDVREDRLLDDTIGDIFVDRPDAVDEDSEDEESSEESTEDDFDLAKEDELAQKGNMKKAFDELPKATQTALENKAKEHNDDVNQAKTKTTTKFRLAVVYWRGVGAYKTNPESVRPTVSSAAQWAMARVNSFLYVLRNGKFKSGKHDTDLLPQGHPMANEKDTLNDDLIFEEFMFDHGGNTLVGDHSKVMKAVGDTDPTNFPKAGDDKAVSLRNSEYPIFDRAFADKLKDEYPEIWRKGGNVLGDTQYNRLSKVLDQNGKVETETDERAVRLREAWAARHIEDFRLPGVVAQIKWFVIGSKGEQYMKDLINEEIKKMESSMNEDTKTLSMRCVNHEQLDNGFNRFELTGQKQRLALKVQDIDVRAFDEDDQEIDVEESLRAIDGRGRPAKYYSIQGIASSTSVDSYGTEMSYRCLMGMQDQFQRGVPLLPRHTSRANGQMAEWDEVIGRTYDAELTQTDVMNAVDMSEKQYTLLVQSRLYGEDKLSRELVKRLRRGEPIGQSIGGWFDKVDVIENRDGVIERVIVQSVQLDHLAITRAPANPDSIGLMTYSKDSTELKQALTEWRTKMKQDETVATDVEPVVESETIERNQEAPTTMTQDQATEDRHIAYVEEDEDYVKVVYEKTHDMEDYSKERMEEKIKEMMGHPETKELMKEYMKEYLAEMLQEEIENNKMEFDELAASKPVSEIEERDLDSTAVVVEPVVSDDDVNGGPDEPVAEPEEITNSPMGKIDRAVMAFNDDLPLAAEDVPWSWNTTTQDEILGEGLDNWDRYAMAHLYRDDNADPETKGAYKLPIALMINGELRVVWNGVVAAMGAINGARGGVDISDDDRQAVYDVLSKYYAKFGKEAPELRATMVENEQKDHNNENSVILSTDNPMGEQTMNEETMKMFADMIGRSVAAAVEPINERLNAVETAKTETVVEPVVERNAQVEELQAIIAKQNELLERALKEPQRVGMRAGQMHKGIGAVSAIETLSERAKKDGAVGLSAIVTRHIDAISEEKSMNDMSVHTIQNLLSAGLRAAEQDGLLGSVDHSWQ